MDHRRLTNLPQFARIGATGLVVLIVLLAGCQVNPARNMQAIHAYYQYDFTTAREEVRGVAEEVVNEQVILNNLRLGLASLADGDTAEAERVLLRVFEWLSTAGLNEDRTTAAVLLHEGVRIWKGEPFEQAMAYYWIASLYATKGDWENVRAAATNALFRLTDFGQDRLQRNPSQADLARRAAEDPSFLDRGYTVVNTNFALGFLMQAIGADLSGAPGAAGLYDAAMRINPHLAPIIDTLRQGTYDTLLMIDYGKGPTKRSYGPDNALSRFEPQDRGDRMLRVRTSRSNERLPPVTDMNVMATDHRWNNLENVRQAKSAIGDVLVTGGFVTASIGANHDSTEAQLAGLAMILSGLLMKSGAEADTRYLEYTPAAVYLVPLTLGSADQIELQVEQDPGSKLILPDVRPGSAGNPRAIYLRLHGPDSPAPTWLTATTLRHGNDHAGVRPGDLPWILGGHDVSTPSRTVMQAYHDHGHLQHMTLADLQDVYRAEELHLGSGMENRPGVRKNPSFRHVLEGGTGLFTPAPDSMGYKRLMYSPARPYTPRSGVGQDLTRSRALSRDH